MRTSRVAALVEALIAIPLGVAFNSQALVLVAGVAIFCTIFFARVYAVRKFGPSDWVERLARK